MVHLAWWETELVAGASLSTWRSAVNSGMQGAVTVREAAALLLERLALLAAEKLHARVRGVEAQVAAPGPLAAVGDDDLEVGVEDPVFDREVVHHAAPVAIRRWRAGDILERLAPLRHLGRARGRGRLVGGLAARAAAAVRRDRRCPLALGRVAGGGAAPRGGRLRAGIGVGRVGDRDRAGRNRLGQHDLARGGRLVGVGVTGVAGTPHAEGEGRRQKKKNKNPGNSVSL